MKIFIRSEAKTRIAQEALTFQGILPTSADGVTIDQAYQDAFVKVMEEINAGDGNSVPDIAIPPNLVLSLKCGLSFVVPAWEMVVDRRSAGIFKP